MYGTTVKVSDESVAGVPALRKAYSRSTAMPGLIFAAAVEALGANLPGVAQDLKALEAKALEVAKALEALVARAAEVRAFREGGR